MALQLLFSFLLTLGLSSVHQWHQNEHSGGPSVYSSDRSGSPVRYYYSREAADYTEAEIICQNNFGDGYGLATIKTKDDLNALVAFLNRNVSPRTDFWIGGSYFQSAKEFVWTNLRDSQQRPLAFAPFVVALIEGYPSTYNLNDRTVFYQEDQYTNKIKIETVTATRKFVCEYRQDREPPACQVKSDVAVLLDSSGSIGASNYQLAKQSAAQLISAFAAKPENRQLGLIFSQVTEIIVPLDSTASPKQKYDQMMKAPYMASITNTGKAVQDATAELQRLRRGVPQMMVVITDGGSTDRSLLNQSVPAAKAQGITMLAVGVGSDIVQSELEFIASDPKLVFTAKDWAALQFKLNEIANSMCPPPNQSNQKAWRGGAGRG